MANHLNTIQQMCTNLQRDSELVLGHVYGLRQWFLRGSAIRNGELELPAALEGHTGYSWRTEGTNTATCDRTHRSVTRDFSILTTMLPAQAYLVIRDKFRRFFADRPEVTHIEVTRPFSEDPAFPQMIRSDSADTFRLSQRLMPDDSLFSPGYATFRIGWSERIPPHVVTAPEHTCGFYAYTDEVSLAENSHRRSSVVFGLVKAYGHVTQGTKGFRAEKAEIVSLTEPLDWIQTKPGKPYLNGKPTRHRGHVPAQNPDALAIFQKIVPESVETHRSLGDMLAAARPLLADQRGER